MGAQINREITARYCYEVTFARERVFPLFASRISPQNIQIKADNTPVTNLDRKIENAFKDWIFDRPSFSKDEIISEESAGNFNAAAEHKWIVDPLDGTLNKISGCLPFAFSIGYWLENKPVFGVIVKTDINGVSVMSAMEGEGISTNGKRERPLPGPQVLIGAIGGMNSPENAGLLKALPDLVKYTKGEIRMIGSTVWTFSEVALGRISFFIRLNPSIWDIAGVSVLLKEAGRYANIDQLNLNFAGLPANNFKVPMVVAAQDRKTFERVMTIIK